MSRPIINATITGIMPAIIMFIDSHSGMNDIRSAFQ
jgi:hypothetical protein